MKVLIVEDEKTVARNLHAMLTSFGYSDVEVVTSGLQAIDSVKAFPPDIILMDIILEGEMDGIDAAQNILQQCDVPIIFLSAYSDEKILQRAKRIDSYGYILKPFDSRDVLTAVELALYKFQVESEVKEQRGWLSTTLQSIADAVIATDTEGIIKFINIIAEQLTGWKQEDAIGKKLDDVFIIENEKTGERLSNPIVKILSARSIINIAEHTILRAKNGIRTIIEESASPILSDSGEVTGIVFTFRDVAECRKAQEELRKSEKRFRALIENASDGITLLGKNESNEDIIVYVSPSVQNILGYTPEELINQNPSALTHPEDIASLSDKEVVELAGNLGWRAVRDPRLRWRKGNGNQGHAASGRSAGIRPSPPL